MHLRNQEITDITETRSYSQYQSIEDTETRAGHTRENPKTVLEKKSLPADHPYQQ
jgi:hypothetical protein